MVEMGEFEPFCETYQDGMFHVAKAVLHDEAMAEDAVQNALTKVWRKFKKLRFETERKEKAYMLRAALNAAIDVRRKTPVFEEAVEECLTDVAVQAGDSTFCSVMTSEMESEIAAAVKTLSPKAQAIFQYRELKLKDVEIAALLGITVSDVRTTVFRSRQTVANHLRERGLYCG